MYVFVYADSTEVKTRFNNKNDKTSHLLFVFSLLQIDLASYISIAV